MAPRLRIVGRKSIDPMTGKALWAGRCDECAFEVSVAESRLGTPIGCASCAAWEADHLSRFPGP